MKYTNHFNTKQTKQTDQVVGKNQIKNSAGGWVFDVGAKSRFDRFLILGSECDSYYVTENKLTVENAKNAIDVIKQDGEYAVKRIVEVSEQGLAPKNDPAIFALSLACTFGDEFTKCEAYNQIHRVCRTGTHLFTFCQYIQDLRGWSRGLRNGVAKFYTTKNEDKLVNQLLKYRQRDGWTHKDVLRLCHAKPINLQQDLLFKYAVGKNQNVINSQIEAFEQLKSGNLTPFGAAELIREYSLTREMVPTELLNSKEVWTALLENMPVMAMIRNLGKMTSIGLVDTNLSSETNHIYNKLTDAETIEKSRIHPMQILLALNTYSTGHGERGKLSWNPVQKINDALNEAFYLAHKNVEATGKNILVGVDTSGSMDAVIAGTSLKCNQAAAVMAMIIARTEPNCEIVGFDTSINRLDIGRRTDLKSVLSMRFNGGGTDCSLPMEYAIEKKIDVDAFVVLSDAQTWAGRTHPYQSLNRYRKLRGKQTKLIGVGMVANEFTMAEPGDVNSLNVVGFDASVPQVISNFVGETV
jgi:60 kDa SS-A/Ro ribonucleoprotein